MTKPACVMARLMSTASTAKPTVCRQASVGIVHLQWAASCVQVGTACAAARWKGRLAGRVATYKHMSSRCTKMQEAATSASHPVRVRSSRQVLHAQAQPLVVATSLTKMDAPVARVASQGGLFARWDTSRLCSDFRDLIGPASARCPGHKRRCTGAAAQRAQP